MVAPGLGVLQHPCYHMPAPLPSFTSRPIKVMHIIVVYTFRAPTLQSSDWNMSSSAHLTVALRVKLVLVTPLWLFAIASLASFITLVALQESGWQAITIGAALTAISVSHLSL